MRAAHPSGSAQSGTPWNEGRAAGSPKTSFFLRTPAPRVLDHHRMYAKRPRCRSAARHHGKEPDCAGVRVWWRGGSPEGDKQYKARRRFSTGPGQFKPCERIHAGSPKSVCGAVRYVSSESD
jgi:hypothetical protein